MTDIRDSSFWQRLLEKLLSVVSRNLQPKNDSERHLHVVSHENGWAVKREGNKRITSKHRKQSTAIRKARSLAKRYGTDVIVHGKDGRIRDRMSYD